MRNAYAASMLLLHEPTDDSAEARAERALALAEKRGEALLRRVEAERAEKARVLRYLRNIAALPSFAGAGI